MPGTPDESAAYWADRYDRPAGDDENEQLDGVRRPRTKAQWMDDETARRASASEPHAHPSPSGADDARPWSPPSPQVRSVTEALGGARRFVDAGLMLALAITCFVGASSTNSPGKVVLLGIGATIYAAWIAISRGSYVMPYSLYVGAAFAALWFFFG